MKNNTCVRSSDRSKLDPHHRDTVPTVLHYQAEGSRRAPRSCLYAPSAAETQTARHHSPRSRRFASTHSCAGNCRASVPGYRIADLQWLFPGRFHDITAAIAFCRTFFPWYNTEHRHGGIAMLTPDDVHHNRTQSVLEQRGRTLQAAWTRHPERFVRGIPQPDPLPQAVWINPPVTPTTGETAQ